MTKGQLRDGLRSHRKDTKARRYTKLPKQIGMAAGADELQFFVCSPIDQQPVRLDVAFPTAFPVPDQDVIAIFVVEWLLANKHFYYCLQSEQV